MALGSPPVQSFDVQASGQTLGHDNDIGEEFAQHDVDLTLLSLGEAHDDVVRNDSFNSVDTSVEDPASQLKWVVRSTHSLL